MSPVSHDMLVFLKPRELLSLDALAHRAGMHPALVERYVELDLVQPCEREGACLFFEPSAVVRLGAVNRLRQSLGINLAGIAVVLDLVDQICVLQRDNDLLRRRQ
jgi:DNA-binding transcriptional MerR regulator